MIISREQNINNQRKWKAPPVVMEAEVHENYYSENESDSEIGDNEASDEDLALIQEIEDSQQINLNFTQSIFFRSRTERETEIDN